MSIRHAAMTYDHIIIGGGCAGLQLARAFLHNPITARQSILIIDASDAVPAKSWCFWADKAHPYTALVEKSWSKLNVTAYSNKMVQEILPLQYQYISSEGFYAYHHNLFREHTHIHQIIAVVQSVVVTDSNINVQTSDASYTGRHVYDSRMPNQPLPADTLQQHFLGWFITADIPCFAADTATLMDFDIADDSAAGFCYVLPFSPQKALVEMTFFTKEVFPPARYKALLQAYLAKRYPDIHFQILKQEVGQIPMTSFRFAGQEGPLLYHIGASAGMTKPSTGFTFTRILRDSEQLVAQLASGKIAPKKHRGSQGRFWFYDTLLLGILNRRPHQLKRLMYQLFRTQSFKRVLLFLDEQTHIGQEAAIFIRLPIRLFVHQIWLSFLKGKQRG